jgi:hypothetical protein
LNTIESSDEGYDEALEAARFRALGGYILSKAIRGVEIKLNL